VRHEGNCSPGFPVSQRQAGGEHAKALDAAIVAADGSVSSCFWFFTQPSPIPSSMSSRGMRSGASPLLSLPPRFTTEPPSNA
jgi:hypothetical protein